MYKDDALRLYLTAFPEDEPTFAEDFLNRFFDRDCRYIIKDGRLISMLFLLDATMHFGEREVRGKYLYAAATFPEYRGQGLMAELIEKAKAETVQKGTESLFGFYGNFGFKTAVFENDTLYTLKNERQPLKEITLEEYLVKRKVIEQSSPYITLNDTDYAYAGLTLYGDENTLAAVDLSATPPHVKEFHSGTENGKDALLCTINQKEAIFRETGITPFAMIIMPNNEILTVKFTLALD